MLNFEKYFSNSQRNGGKERKTSTQVHTNMLKLAKLLHIKIMFSYNYWICSNFRNQFTQTQPPHPLDPMIHSLLG
jgi:hypothetical protein